MPTTLTIPTPCHENWHAMTVVEKGRHCKACDKVLTDFTGMSDQELLRFLDEKDTKLCGRFDRSQLDRVLQPRAKANSGFPVFWKLMVASLLTAGTLQANPRNSTTIEWKSSVIPGSQKQGNTGSGIKRVLKGSVVKAGTLKPVAGATVFLPALEVKVQTDKEGKFTLHFTSGDEVLELDIAAEGLEEQQILITPKERTTVQVYLEEEKNNWQSQDNNLLKIDTVPGLDEVVVGLLVARKEVALQERIVRRVDDWTPEWLRKKELKIAPNPLKPGQTAQVTVKGIVAGVYGLEVLDASGRIVERRRIELATATENFMLQTDQVWGSGLFWVRLSALGSSRVYNVKLVIQ